MNLDRPDTGRFIASHGACPVPTATLELDGLDNRLADIERKLDVLLRPRPVFLDIDGAAAFLSVTPQALRQRLKRDPGFPRHSGLGERSPRFTEAELSAYVTGGR